MRYIGYIFFRILTGIVSIIPFRMLYGLSDFFAFFLRGILRYRYQVVFKNLTHAFPGMDLKEKKRIIRLYYRNLCDVALESIKGYSMQQSELTKRYLCLNPELSYPYFYEGREVIFAMSHYANWEWGTQVAGYFFKHSPATFYKPISNKYIDRYTNAHRKQHQMELISVNQPRIIKHEDSIKPKAYFMLSDQTPSNSKKAFWVKFLNQDTPCLHGIELYSKVNNIPVLYLNVQRVKRGFYTLTVEELISEPSNTEKGEITCTYMQKLEEIIQKKPENWLWSHRRWKHKMSKNTRYFSFEKQRSSSRLETNLVTT